MAELLLVANPRKRRRRRKMSALQRKYFGKKRHRSHKRRRRHVAVAAAPRRRRRRSHGGVRRRAIGYTVGPRKIRRRKLNPHRRHYRRRHHNPTLRGFTGSIIPTARAGLTGATGALLLDAAWGFLSTSAMLSPYLSNQYVGFAAKGVTAVAVGALGGRVMRGKGRDLAVGAMTVTLHDFLKSFLQSTAPGTFGPGGTLSLGSYLSGYGAYLSGSAPIVGTATVPQAYLPFSGGAGASGTSNPTGVFNEDTMGMDPWGGSDQDGRVGYSGY